MIFSVLYDLFQRQLRRRVLQLRADLAIGRWVSTVDYEVFVTLYLPRSAALFVGAFGNDCPKRTCVKGPISSMQKTQPKNNKTSEKYDIFFYQISKSSVFKLC